MAPDRNKAFALSYLTFYQSEYNYAISSLWIKEALDIAEQLKDPKLLYWVHRHYGFYAKAAKNMEETLRHFTKSNEYADKINFARGRIINSLHFSEVYSALGDYEKAFEYAFSNLEARKSYDPDFGFGFAYYFLGNLYTNIKDYPEAILWYSQAEDIFRSVGEMNYVGVTLTAKATALENQNLPDSALVVVGEALEIFVETKSNFFIGGVYRHFGNLQLSMQNYDLALMYFSTADSLLKDDQHHVSSLETIQNAGYAYMAKQQYDEAEKYFKRFLNTANTIKDKHLPSIAYNDLAQLHLKKEDAITAKAYALKARDLALKYQQKDQELTAMQHLLETHFRLKEYQEAENIQKEIATLSSNAQEELQRKNLNNIRLSYQIKRQRDQLEKEKQLVIKNKEWNNLFSWFLVAVFLLVSFLFLQIILITKKRNKILGDKNTEIATLNENLEQKVKARTQDLHQKTQVLNNYFDNLPGVSYRLKCDANFTPIFISNGCHSLLGVTPEFLLHSQTYRNLIHPDYYDKKIQLSNDFVKENNLDNILEIVYPIQTEDQLKWVVDRSKLLVDQDGEKYLQGILLDITDQMIAEAALKISQEELSLIYNNTQDFMGLVRHTKTGNFIFESFNQPYIDYLVRAELLEENQDISGMKMQVFMKKILKLNDDEIQERLNYMHTAYLSKQRINYETIISSDSYGNKNTYDVMLTPIVEEGKETCERIIFVMHDITQRVDAEIALARSEKRLSTIYNSSQDFIGLIKPDGQGNYVVESVNHPAIDFMTKIGLISKPDDLIGLDMITLFKKTYGLHKPGIESRIKSIEAVFSKHGTFKYESLFAPPGKEINLYFETIISPVLNIEGNCTHALYVARDITARKINKDKIIASQKRLSMIFNGAKDQMFIFNVGPEKITFEDANQSFKDQWSPVMSNENIHEVYGKDSDFFLHRIMGFSKERTAERMKLIHEIIREKKAQNYEEVFHSKNRNKKIYMDITATPILNTDNVCEKLLFVVRDVTQKVESQKALAQSEKQLSTIYNSTNDFIGLIQLQKNNNYTIESINQPGIDFLTKTGLLDEPQQLMGIELRLLFKKVFGLSEEMVDTRMEMVKEVFFDHKTIKHQNPLAPLGKDLFMNFETTISPIIGQDGKCTQALYVARDTTESEIAKNKILASQKHLSSIFNGANDQMAIFDVHENRDLIFKNTNKSFQEAWKRVNPNLDLNRVYGKSMKYYMRKVMHFSDAEAEVRLQYCYQILEDHKPYNYEEIFHAHNNKKYILDVTISPILNEEDVCEKLLFVLRDVTLKHKAKEQMISKILETEDRERSRFAKELHDSLGQNLTASSLNFNFVKKGIKELNSDTQKRFALGFKFLKEAIDESRNIAHNLMPQAISDFGYVLSIESLLENLTQTTDIEFTFYDNLKKERLPVDHELSLYRITQEAINNILKHAEATKVTIQLIRHSDSVILTVEDNGKGFDMQPNTLNSFGLNSMRNRASALSGVIDIDGVPGRGTSITLEIPV